MLTRTDLEHELEWLEQGLCASKSRAARARAFHAGARRLLGCALTQELGFLETSLDALRRKHGIGNETASVPHVRRSRKRELTRLFPIG